VRLGSPLGRILVRPVLWALQRPNGHRLELPHQLPHPKNRSRKNRERASFYLLSAPLFRFLANSCIVRITLRPILMNLVDMERTCLVEGLMIRTMKRFSYSFSFFFLLLLSPSSFSFFFLLLLSPSSFSFFFLLLLSPLSSPLLSSPLLSSPPFSFFVCVFS